MPRISLDRMTGVLGAAPKPGPIWQKQFDGVDATLHKIARLDWQDIPILDLWEYTLDMTYQDLQPDLFRHVFPACLRFWYDTLMVDGSAEVGDSDLHRGFITGSIFTKMLDEVERQRLYDFFVDAMLDRMDLELGFASGSTPACGWIGRFNCLGLVAPVIPDLWTRWWSLDTPAKAICAMQYASGLIYSSGENPLYPAWADPHTGGPDMIDWNCSVFDRVWLESNRAFLRSVLTPAYLTDRMALAASVLSGLPLGAVATRLATDILERDDVIQIRIDDMLDNLARLKLDQDRWD